MYDYVRGQHFVYDLFAKLEAGLRGQRGKKVLVSGLPLVSHCHFFYLLRCICSHPTQRIQVFVGGTYHTTLGVGGGVPPSASIYSIYGWLSQTNPDRVLCERMSIPGIIFTTDYIVFED